MRLIVLFITASLALAGCAAPTPTGPADDDFALDDELEATEETGVIRGLVVTPSIEPVDGATITLLNMGRSTTSNADGAFGFDQLAPGTYFMEVAHDGYNGTQASATVVAGVDRPPVVRVLLTPNPTTQPYIEALSFTGYLACGIAVVYTSVGCTTNGFLASMTESEAIFWLQYTNVPQWAQGELVWESTQPAGGQFIWQAVQHNYPGTPQPHIGYMETTYSPALAYLDEATTEEYHDWILDEGIDWRFFAGPHSLCPQHVGDPAVNRFGCGATLEQEAEVYIHHFHNHSPFEGWRLTEHGPPVPPA